MLSALASLMIQCCNLRYPGGGALKTLSLLGLSAVLLHIHWPTGVRISVVAFHNDGLHVCTFVLLNGAPRQLAPQLVVETYYLFHAVSLGVCLLADMKNAK
jgi:hypothetical protein